MVTTIAVLLLGNGVVTAVQGIATEQGQHRLGEVAGLFSPYSLYRGCMAAVTDSEALTPPVGTAMELAYFATFIGLAVVCVGLLLLRYRRLAGR